MSEFIAPVEIGPFKVEFDQSDYSNVNIWHITPMGAKLVVAVDDFYKEHDMQEKHDATVYMHLGQDDPKELIHFDRNEDYSPQAFARAVADMWASEGVDPQGVMWLMERVHKVGMQDAAFEFFRDQEG